MRFRRRTGSLQETGKKTGSIARLFVLFCFFLFSLPSLGQCAMCRAVLETEEGGRKGEAVNDGIVYLMVFPYLLVGILGYVIYRMRTTKPKEK